MKSSLRSLLFVSTFGGALLAADIAVIEEIVAKVNGEIITRSEIERSRQKLAADLAQQAKLSGEALEAAVKEREKDLLRERIDQLLLVQKGKELNINVDQEVSKYLADIQLQYKIADPEKFQAFIKEQTGMPYEDFRAEASNGMLTQRVIRQEVGSKINPPTAELQKYYDEHKSEFMRDDRVFLREIFVSAEGKEGAALTAAEKKAKDLVARARRGEKFPELARDNSDAVTARQMGELGGFKKGELDPALEKIVFEQERNYVTDPIWRDAAGSKGWLILKVEEHHKAGLAAFEEVQNEIMEKLMMPKFQPKIREYLTQLRENAFLEIREGYIDSGAAPGKDTSWSDPAELKPETVTKEEVASQTRRRRFLWMVPIPGTQTTVKSSSK
jgi:peptidyl-prolyl cis-trans isomerase SurA